MIQLFFLSLHRTNKNKMNKTNLVMVETPIERGTTTFKKNNFYRHIVLENNLHLINGETFTNKEFDRLFILAIDRVKADFKKIGILGENDKPISKSLFTRVADIHTYGSGRKGYKIWYFRGGKDLIYGFYPMQSNQRENQRECYQWYLDILNGEVDCLDERDVCFGNCGIPLSYSRLRIE